MKYKNVKHRPSNVVRGLGRGKGGEREEREGRMRGEGRWRGGGEEEEGRGKVGGGRTEEGEVAVLFNLFTIKIAQRI